MALLFRWGVGAENSIIRYNWTHNHRKFGFRYDGKWELDRYGVRELNHHNVAWNLNNCGYRIKGDEHQTYNNTGFDCDYTEIVIQGLTGGNQNSITRNNVAMIICGAKGKPTEPIPGTYSNNWNGYVTGLDIRTQLRDPDNLDFRPKPGSDLIDAGFVIPGITDGYLGAAPDLGAYEYSDLNYWIPVRK